MTMIERVERRERRVEDLDVRVATCSAEAGLAWLRDVELAAERTARAIRRCHQLAAGAARPLLLRRIARVRERVHVARLQLQAEASRSAMRA